MCDAFLQNYAAAVNGHKNSAGDLVPTPVFFSRTHCTGNFQPNDHGGVVDGSSSPFQPGLKVNLAFRILGPRSFYIPFNIGRVRLHSSVQGRFTDFSGPALVANVNTVFWSGTTIPMTDIKSVEVLDMRSWVDTFVPDMCMGRTHSIGPSRLDRYLPAGERCDYFMQNQFCNLEQNASDDRCSCFKDLETVKSSSDTRSMNLPVICFGRRCATTRSYKTQGMLQKPCQLTVCRQVIREDGIIDGDRSRVVSCTGKFFTHQDTITPEVARQQAEAGVVVQENTPSAATWLAIGIGAVLLLVLVVLMFSGKSGATPSAAPHS